MMKSKTTLIFFALSFLFFTNQNHAQVKGTSKVFLQKQMQNISFQDASLNVNNFFTRKASSMGLTAASEMQWTKTFAGENGFQHFRYQQTYQSIPVFGTAYTIHEKNGIVTNASGYYLPLIDLQINPRLKAESAIRAAMQKMDAKVYAFEKEQNANGAFSQNRPTAELVIIDPAFPLSSENYALAYRIELASAEPLDKRQYFIDANSGVVLLDLPLLMHNAVPAQGVTKYYGTQSITVDSLSPAEFLLQDPTRNGNATYNGNLEIWSNSSNSWDLTNEAQDEVAIDAHYCTQEFHDFMIEKLNWNGLDNEGLPMNIVVHAGDFVNAFWNGEYAAFGDGDCNHGPLTTLEVVAHEFMHGITDYTSNLIYSSESGAINESMSDIFGKALEFYTTPDEFDWQLGASFIETPYAESFRSFEDPNSREHPKFYDGEFWQDGGGVHTNSSVGNHWFYQMVNGGSGVNEIGEPYNIEALGMDKAIQIVFLTQKAYLTPNSTYQFYYESSLLAAQELYGENAPEIQSVMEAWKVVGLSNTPGGGGDVFDLGVSFAERIVNTCLNNQFYSTEVTVTNNGTLPYLSNQNVTLLISEGGDNFQEILLSEDLAPGESATYQVTDLIFFEEADRKFVDVLLDFSDDNISNNTSFQLIDNAFYEENDLSLGFLRLSETNCFNNLLEATFSIENNACNALAEGTSFEVQLESQNGFFWSGTYTLPNDLQRNDVYEFEEIFDLEPGELYTGTLIFSEDVNLENNENFVLSNTNNSISEVYENTMVAQDDYLIVHDFSIFDYNYLDYGGNNVLAISSIFDEANRPICLEVEDNISSNIFGKSANLYVCADLANMEIPKLGFDLTQFRNSAAIDFPELENNSTIFKISWTSEDDSFEQIVVGQNEGSSVHYDIPLPSQFKGKIEFDFFHNVGSLNALDYFESDISLFDNLTINEDPVNTQNLNTLPIKIHPNPSTGLLTITHPEVPENLVLRNMHGQTVLTLGQTDNLDLLDLSNLPDSYYFLTIGYGDLGQVTRGVVKMNK